MRQAERDAVILDSINEGVFTVDGQWRISSFNRAAERITGIPREQAIGSRCCEVFRASICEKACSLQRTMDSGKPVVNATAYIINSKGERIPIRIATALLKNRNGKVVGGVETFQDLRQVEQLQKELSARYSFEDIVGRSRVMQKLFEILPQIADSHSTVLVEGPSGTGKELFARAIHNLSARRKGPFVAVNCAALPDSLLESELFGHKAGAFTDAKRDKPGRFMLANKGTLFLDEIGDISPAMQVRLLRVLQERSVEPLGGVKSLPIDVRVIAATNRSLKQLVAKGSFREDLYYRIRVIHLELPGLAERREDIPLLVDHLINRINRLEGRQISGVSPEVMTLLMDHGFPGNVRELENILEQAFVLCRGSVIEVEHLPSELRPEDTSRDTSQRPRSLRTMESVFLAEALRRHGGHRGRAAAELGINVSTLYRKIQALGLDTPQQDGRGQRR